MALSDHILAAERLRQQIVKVWPDPTDHSNPSEIVRSHMAAVLRSLEVLAEECSYAPHNMEGAWSAAMARVYLKLTGCSLPEWDSPLEIADQILAIIQPVLARSVDEEDD